MSYGIAVARTICVDGRDCRNYALTKSRLWVQAPWAMAVASNFVGVLLTSQPTKINGANVKIYEMVVVVPLREVMRMRMGEAVLAKLTREEARVVARALLMATGFPRRVAEDVDV